MNSSLRIYSNFHGDHAELPYCARKHYRGRNLLLSGQGLAIPQWSEPGQDSLSGMLKDGALQGLRAANAAKAPGGFVIGMIAVLVALYYGVPSTEVIFERIIAWKSNYGMVFSFLCMGLAGGILPILLGIGVGMYRFDLRALKHTLYGLFVFGLLGVMSDGLYVFQNYMFGTGGGLSTVLSKIAFDQFVWTILVASPFQLLTIHFRDCEFNMTRFRKSLERPFMFYLKCGYPALLNNWCFWIPLTGLMYTMPTALQIPVASLAVGFWVILLSLTVKGESA